MQHTQKNFIALLKAISYKLKAERGFTLIETIFYISIITVVTGVLLITVLNNLTSYNKSESRQNMFANANDALETIIRDTKYAKSIYTPTSIFDNDAGQLSLETAIGAPTGEITTFVDFYLDNGVVYQKKEGEVALALTSERVVITKLRFSDMTSGTRHSITAEISGRINTDAEGGSGNTATINLASSAALRGAY